MDKLSVNNVLDFWFTKPMNEHWFSSTSDIDQQITDNYESIWQQAKNGQLSHWQESAEGCLALCIVLDQMPLNMFRNQAKGFSTEQQSVGITKDAITKGFDLAIAKDRVAFLYIPLMHSENLRDQDLSVECFQKAGLDQNHHFAKHHRELIREYGRFPHRNEILDRESTQAEIEYLKSKQAFTG
jgi:uncharacterized protein (DUF924 family)